LTMVRELGAAQEAAADDLLARLPAARQTAAQGPPSTGILAKL
jgi:hypothetical protein